VAEVLFRYDDGSEMRLNPVRACAAPTPRPVEPGWTRRGKGFALDGRTFFLNGRSEDLLGLLIDRGGSCDLGTLRREVWADYPCDDSVIRMAISRLRKSLAEALDLPDNFDPIVACGNTYRLAAFS
jgi:hypothetical protein